MPLTCATYSIESHLAPRAFVADVMLYDHLIIPVPADDDSARWAGRDVDRQQRLIELLGKRATSIPWDKALREQWRTRWDAAKAAGADFRDGLAMTPTVLLEKVAPSAMGVVAVAAFSSPSELQTEVGLFELPKEPDGSLQPLGIGSGSVTSKFYSGRLAAVIGREFLVPDDPSRGDEDLLREALDLSSERAFQRKRAAYWRWQDEVLNRSTVRDQMGLSSAVEEMSDLIEDEKRIIRQTRVRLGVSCAFAVGAATVAMFAAPAPHPL